MSAYIVIPLFSIGCFWAGFAYRPLFERLTSAEETK